MNFAGEKYIFMSEGDQNAMFFKLNTIEHSQSI